MGRAIEINLVGNNGRAMSLAMGCVAALFALWGSPQEAGEEVDGERCRRYCRQVPEHRRIQAVEVDPRATRPVRLVPRPETSALFDSCRRATEEDADPCRSCSALAGLDLVGMEQTPIIQRRMPPASP